VCLVGVVARPCPAGVASADPGAGEGPVVQRAERLEAPGEPALVSLYSTELSEITGEGSEVGFEMEATIRRLPCARHDYRFAATSASINDSQASIYEAEVRIVSARLPRPLTCGSALAASVTEAGARVRIEPIGEENVDVTRYSGGAIAVESLTSCATLDELCPGRYKLIASLNGPGPGRRVRIVYTLSVLFVYGRAKAPGRAEIHQCPIV
jgi:hypothetical protein